MVPGVAALPTQWDLLGSQNREETCPLSVGILSIYCCLANPPDLRGLQHPTSLNIAWVFPGPEAQSRLLGSSGSGAVLRLQPDVGQGPSDLKACPRPEALIVALAPAGAS